MKYRINESSNIYDLKTILGSGVNGKGIALLKAFPKSAKSGQSKTARPHKNQFLIHILPVPLGRAFLRLRRKRASLPDDPFRGKWLWQGSPRSKACLRDA